MILTENFHKVTVISIQEKILDAPKAFRIKGELKALITQQHVQLVLDLSAVELVDSAGFGIFISILKRTRYLNGQLKLAGVSPELLDLFSFLSLDKVFQIYQSREEAISDFNKHKHKQETGK
jgi:anti-sigma B factor antagonist